VQPEPLWKWFLSVHHPSGHSVKEFVAGYFAKFAGKKAASDKDCTKGAFEKIFGDVPFKAKPIVSESWGRMD
jgi:hypothetical protein